MMSEAVSQPSLIKKCDSRRLTLPALDTHNRYGDGHGRVGDNT